MRTFIYGILVVSFVGLIACGDKPKKKTTASQPVTDNSGSVEEKQTPVVETTGSDSASLQDVVYFSFDSSDLDEPARASLQQNADWMNEETTRVLTIEGHTDEVGTSDYNLALGENRARTTKDYLVRLGVDGARIQIITYGEERPAGAEDSLNRRSMFVATRK